MHESVLNTSLKKVAKGTGIILVGTCIGIILGLVTRVIIVRYISKAEYGFFSLSLVIVNMLTTIALIGFREGIPRYISYFRGKEDAKRIWGTIRASIQITSILGILLVAVAFFSAEFISNIFSMPGLAPAIKVLSFIIPFNAIADALISIFRGLEQTRPKVYFRDILMYMIRLPLLGLCLLLGWSLVGVLYTYLISAIIMTAVLAIYAERQIPTLIPKTEALPMKKEVICFSLPLLGTSVLGMLVTWTDTLMLGYYKTPDVVGLYNVALPLATYISMILSAIAFIYFPVVSRLYSRNLLKDMKNVYASVTKWVFVFSFPLFLLLFLTPGPSLEFLFGPKYLGASTALQFLALGFFVHAFLGPNGITLIALGRTRLTTFNAFMAIITNIVLNLILIPRYGLEGAAVASTVSLSLGNILTSIQIHMLGKVHPFTKNYLRVMVTSVILTIIVYKIAAKISITYHMFTPLLLGLFFVITLLSVLLTRSLDREDIMIIKAIELKFGIGNLVSRRALNRLAK